MIKTLAWAGAITGIIGAILLSLNVTISGYGYLFFIVSSICLMLWAFLDKQDHQLTMQTVFTLINFNGCVQWLM